MVSSVTATFSPPKFWLPLLNISDKSTPVHERFPLINQELIQLQEKLLDGQGQAVVYNNGVYLLIVRFNNFSIERQQE